MLLLSRCVSRDVDDLELDAVGIVEEHCVVPKRIRVLARRRLDLCADLPQPPLPLVDRRTTCGPEREMVQADLVAVVRLPAFRCCLPQADRRGGAEQVVDRLAALALHFAEAVIAERAEEITVERQAPLER